MSGTFVARARLEQLRESAYHCRSTWGDLDGLTASVEQHGVLELVTVRRLQKTMVDRAPVAVDEPLELVFGHRRRRAALAAGLEELDVIVREDLDEAGALALQMVENVQRADLHAIDEGDAYRRLVQLGRSVEEIAAQVGRSRSTVYGRIALAELPAAAREALVAGRMHVSVGLLIARLPEAVREAATKKLAPNDLAMSHGVAEQIVRQHFTLNLGTASFSRSAKKLLPTAGACTTCPKRTGAQAELFEDGLNVSDLCLDVKCFRAKEAAHLQALATKVEAQGGAVLDEKASARIMGNYNTPIGGYVLATELIPGTGMTFEEAAKKAAKTTNDARPTLAKRSYGGPVVVYDKASAEALARAVGGDLAAAKDDDAELEALRAKQKAEEAARKERKQAAERRLCDLARETLDAEPVVRALLMALEQDLGFDHLFDRATDLGLALDQNGAVDELTEAEQRALLVMATTMNLSAEDVESCLQHAPASEPPASAPKPRARGRAAS